MRLVPLPAPPALQVPAASAAAGLHALVAPAAVVRKLVVDPGGLRPSYLGPSESRRVH